MSEAPPPADRVLSAKSAGTMLREARQAQGLHIAALAASIKVSQRKLELLESDRVEDLPDATFARALAQTVCRSLKIDAAPILAALPQAGGYRLETVGEGINMPFRDRPGRHEPTDFSAWASPAVWAPALIVAAALAVYLMPGDWIARLQQTAETPPAQATVEAPPPPPVVTESVAVVADPAASMPAEVASAASAAASDALPGVATVETVHSTPDSLPIAEAAASGVALGPLQLQATEESWIEVVDARSQVLMSRMLQPGETVVLDGAMPLKLKVGNAARTQVAFRGQPIDLAASTRDNVARFELK